MSQSSSSSSSKPILDFFSLRIEVGSKLALFRSSGAGKSSIFALLPRFYDPSEGRILIDGKEIRKYNLRKLRSQIGYVQQELLLFSCTIRENVRYSDNEASEAEITEVSRAANIHDFNGNLPEGYTTMVGEKEGQLSGRQKQRIAIARALLEKPLIMLLDEATSALDAESEKAVVGALDSVRLKCDNGFQSKTTQVIIAHRLSTIIDLDVILIVDKGKVAEMGTNSTLIAAPDGVHSRLYHLQSFSKN